jgi:exodeoxyribonuclease V beta subunit
MLADLGSEQFEQHREQAQYEQLAEDLRVLYVAITRAKYRCYIAWADTRTANEPNKSALSYLLFGHQEMDFAQQQAHFISLCQQAPDTFTYQLLATSAEINGQHRTPTQHRVFSARQWQNRSSNTWQMSSYTALSALSQHDSPELPADKVQETQVPAPDQQHPEPIPRGAHTGNVLHALLENISFQALANDEDISAIRDSACQRFGLHLEQPELLDSLLTNVVRTPLSVQDDRFILANLNNRECLKEMPFYLSMDKINTGQINSILADLPTFQALTDKQMRGYLTGFIDLICRYQGRYYVLDYKSNGLPDYQASTLTHAMREHNYGLQYWIYTLVLHRYLQNRLANYSYARHFGGVRYLFIRGMQPEQALSGVYQDMPDIERIEQLSALFGGQ